MKIVRLDIDTSDREKIVIGIDEKRFETGVEARNSQKILYFIDEILKRNNFTVQDIKEIKVNTGPGSFTGLRIGIAIANTLAFGLGITVNGKKTEDSIDYS